ncbi:MAG: hypothetical protein ABR538_12000 [Candidatus Binatia bacterium]
MKRLLLLLALVPTSALAAPEPLTQCGQTVTDAVLTADLDCSGADGPAILLAGKANLDLAGFTLTGSTAGAVRCEKRCNVVGGGSIVAPVGLDTDVEFAAAVGPGDSGRSRVSVSGINVTGYRVAVGGKRVDVSDVAITSSWTGLSAGKKVTATNSTISACDMAVNASRVTLTDVTIVNSGRGAVNGDRVVLSGTSISQSGGLGLSAQRLTASNSTVIDNCLLPTPYSCVDIFAGPARPKLTDTVCGTSLKDTATESWGICTTD